MFEVSNRFALLFYNVSGVIFCKYEDHEFKLSKTALAWNIIAAPLLILTFYLSFGFFQDIIYDRERIQIDNYSVFTVFLMTIEYLLTQWISVVLCFVQLWRRKDLLKILNLAIKQHSLLDSSLKEKLRQLALRHIFISSFLSTTNVFIQFSVLRFSFFTFLISIIACYPYMVAMSFLSCVKSFESFLLVSIEDFDIKQKKSLENPEFDLETFQRLSANYQSLHRLSETFNRDFGLILTTLSSYFIIVTTLSVRCFDNF